MTEKTETMIVDKIFKDGKNVTLYAKGELQRRIPYHINATKADNIKVGDKIIYEPYGVNFGYFVSKVKK
jgi:hypothetical protein